MLIKLSRFKLNPGVTRVRIRFLKRINCYYEFKKCVLPV